MTRYIELYWNSALTATISPNHACNENDRAKITATACTLQRYI